MYKKDFLPKDEPYSISLPKGKYLFQCWGASGSMFVSGTPGRGGYTSGIIILNSYQTFYIYVGKKGSKESVAHFNLDISNRMYTRGGAATDIRLFKGQNWYDFESLASRIMVAGGGGSSERCDGSDAGGLSGYTNSSCENFMMAESANQTNGGKTKCYKSYGCGSDGKFGIAGEGFNANDSGDGPGGGSGYYGGGGVNYAGSGGGGSSYVSGHIGCDSITADSTEGNIIHTGNPIHYSGVFFYDSIIKGGYDKVISPTGKEVIGNTGNGFARITFLSGGFKKCTCTRRPKTVLLMLVIISTVS